MHSSIANRLYDKGIFDGTKSQSITTNTNTERERFMVRLERYEKRRLKIVQDRSVHDLKPIRSVRSKRRVSLSSLDRYIESAMKNSYGNSNESDLQDFDSYLGKIKRSVVSQPHKPLVAIEPSHKADEHSSHRHSNSGMRRISVTRTDYDKGKFDLYVSSIMKHSTLSKSPDRVEEFETWEQDIQMDTCIINSVTCATRMEHIEPKNIVRSSSKRSSLSESPTKIFLLHTEPSITESNNLLLISTPSPRRLSINAFPKQKPSKPSDFNWLSCRKVSFMRHHIDERKIDLGNHNHLLGDSKEKRQKRDEDNNLERRITPPRATSLWSSLRHTSSELARIAREQNHALDKQFQMKSIPLSSKVYFSKKNPRSRKREISPFDMLTSSTNCAVEKNQHRSRKRQHQQQKPMNNNITTSKSVICERERSPTYSVTQNGSPEDMRRLKILWGCHEDVTTTCSPTEEGRKIIIDI
jgi:hypothetical protein